MFGSTFKFGFKSIGNLVEISKVARTWIPFYVSLKSLNLKLFTNTSLVNCYNNQIPNPSSLIRKPCTKNSHVGLVPSALIMSFSFPFFGNKSEEEENQVSMTMKRAILAVQIFLGYKSEEENQVIMTMKRAILAMQRGDPAKAEQLLHIALKLAQETGDQPAITYIYDLLANFALQNEEFKKAEDLFVSVLKRFLQDGMAEDDNAVVEVSLKLATIYSHLGDNEKACQGFQFCIGTQETKLKAAGEDNVDEDTLVLWAMSHDWFARFLLSLAHYDRAKEHFKRAYDVCVKVKGEEDPQVAVLLNDLGSVCSLQQNYEEAIDYLNKAIYLAKLHQSEDLASFYVNLGTIYMQKKVYDEAEQNCKEGRRIAKSDKNKEALNESLICLKTLKELRA